MSASFNAPILQSDVLAMFNSANAKTTLGGVPYTIVTGSCWNQGTVYSSGSTVMFNGSPFVSKINGNITLPTSHLWQGINNRGTWVNTNTYSYLDMVQDPTYGNNYIFLSGSATNNPPLINYVTGSKSWGQQYLTAYNGLRTNALNKFNNYDANSIVSGQWPLTGLVSSYSPSGVGNLSFYYPDNGNTTMSVVLTAGLGAFNCLGEFSTQAVERLYTVYNPSPTQPAFYSGSNILLGVTKVYSLATQSFNVTVGGSSSFNINGAMTLYLSYVGDNTSSIPSYYNLVGTNESHVSPPAGYNSFYLSVLSGVGGNKNPQSLITIDSSSWFAPVTMTNVGGGYSLVKLLTTISGSYAPKKYTLKIMCQEGNAYVIDTGSIYTPILFNLPIGTSTHMTWAGSATLSQYPSMSFVSGIHNSLGVKKINITDSYYTGNGHLGAGVYWGNSTPLNNWSTYPFPQPTFGAEQTLMSGLGVAISPTTNGYFFGNSKAINDLGLMNHSKMPHNLLYRTDTLNAPSNGTLPPIPCNNPYTVPLTVSGVSPAQTVSAGAYSQAISNPNYVQSGNGIWEAATNPFPWQANTWYPYGFQIRDRAGNIQTVTSSVAGLTGNTYPSFATTSGSVTNEGGYMLNGATQSQAKWVCTLLNKKNYPSWQQNTLYALGQSITDSNGNIQTMVSGWFPNHYYSSGSVISGGGVSQQVSNSGTSSTSQPSWNTTIGANTYDNSVTWTSMGSQVNSLNAGHPSWASVYKPIWSSSMAAFVGDTIIDGHSNTQSCIQTGFSGQVFPLFISGSGVITADNQTVWKCLNSNSLASTSTWIAGYDYTATTIIVDSNGNEQSCIQSGIAGTSAPTWGTALNSTISDGGIVWKLTSLGTDNITDDGGVKWRLTTLTGLPALPAVSRPYNVPKYPTARLSGSYNLPSAFNSAGWWIYEVSLNRLGVDNGHGFRVAQSGSIPVQLGCIRNGSFVSFGTYDTGTTFSPMWPIFTSNKLIYSATEEVDVQAVAIACGNSFTTGGTISYPICATHLNDVNSLLNLIS